MNLEFNTRRLATEKVENHVIRAMCVSTDKSIKMRNVPRQRQEVFWMNRETEVDETTVDSDGWK